MLLPKPFLWTPSRLISLVLWILAVLSGVISLLPGLGGFSAGYGITGVLFIFFLCWGLALLPPRAVDLPDLDLFQIRRRGLAAAIGLIIVGIIVLVILGLMITPGFSILLLFAVVGLVISVRFRRELTSRLVITAVLVGAVSAAGTAWLGNSDMTWAVINLISLPFIFCAGALLAKHSALARVRILESDYRQALAGFGWGCILAVPAALFNLLGNLQAGDTWVQHPWQPFYAIVPALSEETWARLFLLTLVYALLRPFANRHPGRSVVTAVLISSLVHGFAHTGINPIGLVIGSLLYGIPAGLLLIKKDFEHAAGYHFLIDLLRWVAALAA